MRVSNRTQGLSYLVASCFFGCGLFTTLTQPREPAHGEACGTPGERFEELICLSGTWIGESGSADVAGMSDGPTDLPKGRDVSTFSDSGLVRDAAPDSPNAPDAGMKPSLVLHLTFDEGMGSHVSDSSQYGHDGVMTGATWVNGRIGSHALKFGDDALVTVADAPVFNSGLNGDGVTVTAWVKFSGFLEGEIEGGDPSIVAKGDGLGFILGLTGHLDDSPRFRVTTTEGMDAAQRYKRAALGKWIFYAGVYNGEEILLYRDNTLWASSDHTGTLEMPPGDIVIGKRLSYDSHIEGTIDDVRIYDRALSVAELEEISHLTD
jgi:hypothetical protein